MKKTRQGISYKKKKKTQKKSSGVTFKTGWSDDDSSSSEDHAAQDRFDFSDDDIEKEEEITFSPEIPLETNTWCCLFFSDCCDKITCFSAQKKRKPRVVRMRRGPAPQPTKEVDDLSDSDTLSEINYFSYNAIKDLSVNDNPIRHQGYSASYVPLPKHMKDFIRFEKINDVKREEAQSLSQSDATTGWKLHISIDATREDGNLSKAWNAIINVLMRHEISDSKVIREKVRRKMVNGELTAKKNLGKECTIYIFQDAEKKNTEQWQAFIEDLENALRTAKIKPGQFNSRDERVPGSLYLSCRDDSGDHNISVRTIKPNPLQGVTLSKKKVFINCCR